jgi:hypothetical protein
MPAKKTAKQKYGNGTTYRANGKTHKRVSAPGTKRGDAYCARTVNQTDKNGKRTEKIKQRRKDWGCSGKKSIKR